MIHRSSHLQISTLHAVNDIFDAGNRPGNNMHLSFDTDADDIMRIRDAALVVNNISLRNNMHDAPIHRDNNRLCSFYDTINIMLVYFAVSCSLVGNGDDAAGINPFNVGAADSRNAVSNFHAGHHLCCFHRFVDSLYGFFNVDNSTFP